MSTYYTPSEAMLAFMRQNPLCGSAMTFEQIETADKAGLAGHHSGGLVVLSGQDVDGNRVKFHDSWGDDYTAIVHTYDPDAEDPDGDTSVCTKAYEDPRQATQDFLSLVGLA